MLIIGGADTRTGEDANTRKAFRDVERYAAKRFDITSIKHYWSDEFFEPADGMPYIGRAPGTSHRNVYIATGYSGTGLTYGTAAAMLISDLILGRKNQWEKAFNPGRAKLLASAKHVMEEVGATVKGLVGDRLSRSSPRRVSGIERDSGKIISLNGERVAAYRDSKGRLQAVSATCTHTGCMVEWNNAEKHWDCKCHGSLFKPNGEPFAGPATKPLEKKAVETRSRSRKSKRARKHQR
jgi:Rieske Fe-S protein